MEFTAALVGSLSWPLVIVVLAVLLRRYVIDAIRDRSLQSLEMGPSGLKLSFVERVLRTASEVIPSPDLHPEVGAQGEGAAEAELEQLMRLVEISPNAAVMDAFSRVERALGAVVETDPWQRRPTSPRQLARLAVEQRWLSPAVASSVDELAQLRNAVAHGEGTLTPEQAKWFVNLASGLLILLRGDPPRR